jgi:hypothetical protein
MPYDEKELRRIQDEEEEYDTLKITDEVLPMDADESL